ncbi:GtrA family protein [Clostridium sp. LBM24168]
MVSIIIPTFKRKMNVVKIAEGIRTTVDNVNDYEFIFVDDNMDDTTKYMDRLKYTYKNIRWLHSGEQEDLATAVASGISISRGSIIVVMDSDLQHSSELLPEMVDDIKNGYDIVIPSRHLSGTSHTAAFVGKFFLKELRNISDPTGGFFAFRREILNGIALSAIGWRILVEILVLGKYTKVKEIPYKFGIKDYDNSNMSFSCWMDYLKHIFNLVRYSVEDRRIFLFAVVGFLGILVNMTFYNIFVLCGIAVGLSGTFSAIIAMALNFVLNRNITWRDKKSNRLFQEAMRFLVVSSFGITINIVILSFLHYKFKVNYNIANLTGICGAVFWNYNLNRLWTWKND